MEKRTPIFHGPNTWQLAREQYLSGVPAKVVCENLGIRIHALKQRMKTEGWTRRAHALATDRPPAIRRVSPPAAPVVETVEAADWIDDQTSASDVAGRAVRQAAQALAEGRLNDAAQLTRTAESIARLLTHLPPPAQAAPAELDETRRLLLWTLQGDWENLGGGDGRGPPPGWRPMR